MGRMADVVALVLAGGRGSRLAPLTDHRSKPAVPLAGSFSLIDATLSNLANSGLRTVWIAEQYRPGELKDPSRYGVVQLEGDRVAEYAYKPSDPAGSRVATEVFVFSVAALCEACDALVGPGSNGEELADYGDTILPHMVAHGWVHSFDLRGYWRDLGTIDGDAVVPVGAHRAGAVAA